jgi:phage regulator Rha-like protein
MKALIPMDKYGIFADTNNKPKTNSLFVAEWFNKDHKHVLRDIENLDCSDEFRQTNFGLS